MPDDRVDATAAAWRMEVAGAFLPARQGEAVRVDRAAASEAGAASARA